MLECPTHSVTSVVTSYKTLHIHIIQNLNSCTTKPFYFAIHRDAEPAISFLIRHLLLIGKQQNQNRGFPTWLSQPRIPDSSVTSNRRNQLECFQRLPLEDMQACLTCWLGFFPNSQVVMQQGKGHREHKPYEERLRVLQAGENESQGRPYHSPKLPEMRLVAQEPQGCGSASSPRQLSAGQRETAWSCTKFRLDIRKNNLIRKNFFTGRAVKHWNSLPRKVVESQSLGKMKRGTLWYGLLGTLVFDKRLDSTLEVISNLNDRMILLYHNVCASACKLNLMYDAWYQRGRAISCRCWAAQLKTYSV